MYSRQKKIIRLGTKASWQVLNLFRPVLGLVLITQLVWGYKGMAFGVADKC